MCDAWHEPPPRDTPLYMYWHDPPFPEVGEEHEIPVGNVTFRVRITKVKDTKIFTDGRKQVSMVTL